MRTLTPTPLPKADGLCGRALGSGACGEEPSQHIVGGHRKLPPALARVKHPPLQLNGDCPLTQQGGYGMNTGVISVISVIRYT
jgi:hypothetical protein